MRRLPAFLLLLGFFVTLSAGCGDDGSADPTQVVESWSQAITGNGDEKAAGFFAPDAVVIQDGRRTTLVTDGKITLWHQLPPAGSDQQAS